MQVQILDNLSQPTLSAVLQEAVEGADDVRMAVAFVSARGVASIKPSVMRALRRGSRLEFLTGLDMVVTEPDALCELYDLCKSAESADLYCCWSVKRSAQYHPKLYLCRAGGEATCIIGSSNLTGGGLWRNREADVVLVGEAREEPISDAYATYARFKFLEGRVVPDEDLLTLYEELWSRRWRHEEAWRSDRRTGELMRSLRAKAASLARPKPGRRDLLGWLELVYDSLPAGEFTNAQVYEHEPEFRERYPENENIRAKVRQQLQVLRDMGMLEHLGRARWRKV